MKGVQKGVRKLLHIWGSRFCTDPAKYVPNEHHASFITRQLSVMTILKVYKSAKIYNAPNHNCFFW